MRPWAADLLNIWFHELGEGDWFRSSESVDRMLRVRFERKLMALGAEPVQNFLSEPRLAQAAILLFDQVPRNIYRDTPRAFAYDNQALALTKHALSLRWDAQLPDEQRQFIAMPLMHSENLADQKASLVYFREHLPGNVSFAESHHTMIARFGRFPHRNAALGRTSTPEELTAIDAGFSW